jgi:hypothetical protein
MSNNQKSVFRRTHTGKRPYRCPFDDCSKSFVRKTVLTKHMKTDHTTNGRRPSVQWQPFIEERRIMLQQQQQQQQQLHQQQQQQQHQHFVSSCTCVECSSNWSPPTPSLSCYGSPYSSHEDSNPSSPTSSSWSQSSLSWSPNPPVYERDQVVLPSLSSLLIPKYEFSGKDSSVSIYPS